MLAKKFTKSMIDCCCGQQHRHNDVKVGYLRNPRNQERKKKWTEKNPTDNGGTYLCLEILDASPLSRRRNRKKKCTLLLCI